MKIALADAVSFLNTYKARFDAGYLRFYTGAIPASVAAGISGLLVGQLQLAATAFPVTATNVLTANAVAQDPDAARTDTIGYAAGCDSLGNLVSLFTVGLVGSGADVELNTLDAIQNLPITCSLFRITFPLG